MGPRQCRGCWGGGGGKGLALLLDGVKCTFSFGKKGPTRPGIERLIGQGRGPRAGRATAPGEREGAGAQPLPVGTQPPQEPGPRDWGTRAPRLQAFRLTASQVLGDQVCLVMLGEVVTPHETLLTLGTLEALIAWKRRRRHPHSHLSTRSSTGGVLSSHPGLVASHHASFSFPLPQFPTFDNLPAPQPKRPASSQAGLLCPDCLPWT